MADDYSKAEDPTYKTLIPRTADKNSDPKSPTFYDWQSKETAAESKRDAKRKIAPKKTIKLAPKRG